jgi:hypothetical protein
MLGKQFAVAGAMVAVSLTGCVGSPKVLDPRSPPPKQPPPVQAPRAELPQGHGRVVLHTTDEPMQITARADASFVPPGHSVAPTRSGELCVTPCVVDLPVGRYKLFMTSADGSHEHGDTDHLTVRDGVNYYVRAPGRFEPPTWTPAVPALFMVGAALLFATGVVVAIDEDSGRQVMGMAIAGAGLGIGVVGGIMAYDQGRGTIQEGATTAWWEPRE